MNEYGRLSLVPTDIRFTIFLNTPPDALDSVCRNDIFNHWCQDITVMTKYVERRDLELLQRADGFLIAANDLGSVTLSHFLTDSYLNNIDPNEIKINYNYPMGKRIIYRPKYLSTDSQPLINFCRNADFRVSLFNRPDGDIVISDILTIVIKYGLINRHLFNCLFNLYLYRHHLMTESHSFKPDNFLIDTFPTFFKNRIYKIETYCLEVDRTEQNKISIDISELTILFNRYTVSYIDETIRQHDIIDGNQHIYKHIDVLSNFLDTLLPADN